MVVVPVKARTSSSSLVPWIDVMVSSSCVCLLFSLLLFFFFVVSFCFLIFSWPGQQRTIYYERTDFPCSASRPMVVVRDSMRASKIRFKLIMTRRKTLVLYLLGSNRTESVRCNLLRLTGRWTQIFPLFSDRRHIVGRGWIKFSADELSGWNAMN